MRKRSKRKIRHVLVDPVKWAIDGARVTPSDLLETVRLRELSAIQSFASGAARLDDFDTAVAMVNLCEHMAKRGIGPEALEATDLAQAGLIEAARRMETSGKLGVTGPTLQALRDVYQYHDLQRQCISRGEYEAHIARCTAELRCRSKGVIEL